MSASQPPHLRTNLGQFGVLLGLGAVALLCIGVMLFVIDLRAMASKAVDSERDLRAVILARCEARVAYDKRFVGAARGDAAFYAELLRIAEQTELPEDISDDALAGYEAQKAAVTQAMVRKQEIVAEGVIDNCDVFESERS